MSKLLLDTSAYAAFKRGHESAIRALRQASLILLPTVVLGELWAGFEAGAHRDRNRSELDMFLANPRVRVVSVSDETAERYAVIYAYLRGIGRPVPTNDLWIGASAMQHSAWLLTTDAHFLVMPQIVVHHLSGSD